MIGKIYKIYCDITNLTYYGSTTHSLSKRLRQHQECKTTMVRKMENPKIELIEELDFESREKMLERERFYIENNECCNKYIPLRTKKEYYEANKEKINQRKREYYEENRQEIKEKRKEYYEKNKEQISKKINQKIECDCGSIICRGEKARHLKTKKHLNFINSHQHH